MKSLIICKENNKTSCKHLSTWKKGGLEYTVMYKPVGDRDHEVLGMGSFGEFKLYGKST
jgi:hypothetical protein